MPFFSIIIPVHNRKCLIERAIDSCLSQSFSDFEIVVVDDASTDGTVDSILAYDDKRIRLLKNDINQERLISRNKGANISTGEWIIWLDSDDELTVNALEIIKSKIYSLDDDSIQVLRFRCRLDSGCSIPEDSLEDDVWDYEKYITWIEQHHGKWSETLPVVSRKTIKKVLYPEDKKYTGEMQYHLELSLHYKVKLCREVLRLYHNDSGNNTTNPNINNILNSADVFANRLKHILSVHGSALKGLAPLTYQTIYRGMVTQLLLASRKTEACEIFIKGCLSNRRLFNIKTVAIICIGSVSAKLLAKAKAKYLKYSYTE